MSTIDQVKKLYTELTAPERFALIYAADMRGDHAEADALVAAAPKVTIEYPHTLGITRGFLDLADHHAIQQLGAACTFWVLGSFDDDDPNKNAVTVDTDNGVIEVNAITARILAARRFIEGLEAFRAVCAEYKIDPEPMRERSGYIEVLTMTEFTIRQIFDFYPPELTAGIEETKKAYREFIENSRARCYEARAR